MNEALANLPSLRGDLIPRSRKSLGWAVLALVVLLVGAEITLRCAFGLGRPVLYTADSQFGYLPAPNQDVRRFGANVHINGFGMRSDDVPSLPVRPGIRLLFIGDSLTFGTTTVNQDRIFTELIKTGMRSRSGRPVEVLNASAGGWAPENEYQFLRTRGTFGALVVIFTINTNDLDQPFSEWKKNALIFPTANPRSAIEELWNLYVLPQLRSGISVTDPGAVSETVPDANRNAKVLWALEAARDYAEGRGAHFAIIYSPSTFADERSALWATTVGNLIDWAKLRNIKLIDMRSAYSRYPHDAVYKDDVHLRPFGHTLVAAEFMKYVDEMAYLR